MALKGLSPSQFERLSNLLDELLEMDARRRETRLRELDAAEPLAADWLRQVLAPRDCGGLDGFLDKGDILARHASLAQQGTASSQPDTTLAGRKFGPYRVVSLLGHGGMGSVWLAERSDGLFARRIALKLVHPALMGELMTERTSREREILASLVHPHIARLLDAGYAEDGQPYLALEYVDGASFVDYCDRHRLPIRERLALFLQVLSAVQYAHAHLVIHRDLKPSNVLVTAEGHVHLLDFGIAKLMTEGGRAPETELTQAGARLLTPDYAAPEQIAGAAITTAVDVYALGVMLYETLTGERPYRPKRDSRGALEEAILQAEPLAPSRANLRDDAASARGTTIVKLGKSLRGDLDTIVLKALKKLPGERYATVNAFADDLERYLRGDIVLAQRDTVTYRALKFAQRHRAGIAVAAFLAATLIGGLAATSYEARIASAERDSARQAQLRSLTQTAAARLAAGDAPGAMSIILEVLSRQSPTSYTPEALNVFQEARAADVQRMALIGHHGPVRSAAYSPDGHRIVTASYDGTARVWDSDTGRELLQLRGHSGRVICAVFSPDGRRIGTASSDKTARLWDAATGRPLMTFTGHRDELTSVAFSPDSRRLVTASYDKTARIWDVATGRELTQLVGHTEIVSSAAFSPDGKHVVTASSDGTARIWDASSGAQLMQLKGHTDRVWSAAYSANGQRIVTASFDKTARIWDAVTGRELEQLRGHTGWLSAAAFSPDGRRVVTSSLDKTARIWDVASGTELLRLSGHTQWLLSAAWSPDGQRVVTASTDSTARIWDVRPTRELMRLTGHASAVGSAAYSSDGRRIVTGSLDRTARVWDAATGRELVRLSGHSAQVTSAAFSQDGRHIVTASFDKTARIWDAASGRQITQLIGHTDRVWFAAFSPDGHRVVTASIDGTARIWDPVSGRELTRLSGHRGRVWSAVFSPDGTRVLTASEDKTARIWDAASGRQLVLLSGHQDTVGTAAFSPDGLRVVTASQDHTARVWDARTGRQLLVLTGHEDGVECAAFSPDGGRIATASDDGTIRVWDAETGQQLMVLAGFSVRVETAQFSPDGQRILTAANDATPRIWNAHTAGLDAQIRWAEAAQFDTLPDDERFRLGLPVPTELRRATARRSRPPDPAHVPNALAHLAEQEEDAARRNGSSSAARAHWLAAFRYYAAAAEQARRAGWPDAAWRNWRYMRASLARRLADAGQMEQVATAYRSVEQSP